MEKYLKDAMRASELLRQEQLAPAQIVRQIQAELLKKRFIWMGNEVYVPNRLIISYANISDEARAEMEAIFTGQPFLHFVNQYISERGFKVFDALKAELKPGAKFSIECFWPHERAAAEAKVFVSAEPQRRQSVSGCAHR